MPKYVIEREIPNFGKLSQNEVRAAAQKSSIALQDLGSEIQWIESYITDHTLYCVYVAPNEDMIREHARQGGLPANRISQVRSILRPLPGGISDRMVQ